MTVRFTSIANSSYCSTYLVGSGQDLYGEPTMKLVLNNLRNSLLPNFFEKTDTITIRSPLNYAKTEVLLTRNGTQYKLFDLPQDVDLKADVLTKLFLHSIMNFWPEEFI